MVNTGEKLSVSPSPVMQIVRICLLLFNAAFWITGFCLFVIGIWAAVELNKYDDIQASSSNDYNAVSVVLIVIGLIIACIGICGCCGALKKNVYLLKTFAVFLGIIVLCELCVAVSGYAYKNKIKSALSRGLRETMRDYKNKGVIQHTWDKMQENFHCCGNRNYSDWFNVTWKQQISNFTNNSVPSSCCKHEKTGCNIDHFHNRSQTKKWIYTKGCYDSITDFFQSKFSVLAAGALGVAIIQIIGVACAACFSTHIKRKTKYELV